MIKEPLKTELMEWVGFIADKIVAMNVLDGHTQVSGNRTRIKT